MRAVVFARPGPPDVLHVVDVPTPEGAVVVDVVAAAVNPVDVATRSGLIPTRTPAVIGWDLAGVVRSAQRATGFVPGDRVIGTTAQLGTGIGSTAEVVAIDGGFLAQAPASVPLRDAAALPLAGLTGLQAVRAAALAPGLRALVIGAQGAVGQFAAGFAARSGAHLSLLVRATDVATWRGAVEDFGYGAEVLTDVDLKDQRFDVIIDCAGRPETVRHVVAGGTYVSITTFALPDPGDFTLHHLGVEVDAADLREVVRAVDAGEVFVQPVAAVYPFGEAAAAHRRVEQGSRGKVLLVPDPGATS
ncbi:zinc-binding dehydrogenase [Tsukamurella ocularis]|uniref:zinc-binding dehydrogenase n=1 Tax=Tsukamurella ocularis TaxID=1970234 RepID=UPI002169C784|nr:zinc-binding dehydrogenase [Tsukamurella ocularis]MCS3780012.1 NADPH:quinone reductase-like Zn-dependent oxidoreductase [Tsukamurella ocularis]MCS3788588.1 NADPH:quinone reductase-like Zn-dependent oxidoreductase [Tsukamurella ocularis]MCS3849798.1 NADPH:quinone reductase-like Zn-dependent oxidoreductase [Tsukamurella ocularis]